MPREPDLSFELRCEREIAKLDKDVAVLKEQVNTIRSTQEATGQLPSVVAKWQTNIEGLQEDIHYLRNAIRKREEERKRERDERRKEAQEEQKQRRIEKRSDRRWIVGTMLTAAGLIVAAIGLLASTGVI